jgi:hypothetical protein
MLSVSPGSLSERRIFHRLVRHLTDASADGHLTVVAFCIQAAAAHVLNLVSPDVSPDTRSAVAPLKTRDLQAAVDAHSLALLKT